LYKKLSDHQQFPAERDIIAYRSMNTNKEDIFLPHNHVISFFFAKSDILPLAQFACFGR